MQKMYKSSKVQSWIAKSSLHSVVMKIDSVTRNINKVNRKSFLEA